MGFVLGLKLRDSRQASFRGQRPVGVEFRLSARRLGGLIELVEFDPCFEIKGYESLGTSGLAGGN